MKTAYKVLLLDSGKLYSVTHLTNFYSVEYSLGKTIRSAYPLFVFQYLHSAQQFMDSLDERDYQIWEVQVDMLMPPPEEVLSRLETQAGVDWFWNNREYSVSDPATPPIGTKICRQLVLIKRII